MIKGNLFIQFCAGFSALLGILGLAGHVLEIEFLYTFLPGHAQMQNFTASGLLMLSLCCWLGVAKPNGFYRLSRRLFGWSFALLCVSLALRALFVDFKISSPQTLFSFGLISLGGSFLKLRNKKGVYPGQFLLLFSTLLALSVLCGHLFNASRIFESSKGTGMSIPTALGILLLSLGTLSLSRNVGFVKNILMQGVTGEFLRRLIFWALSLPIIISAAVLYGEQSELYSLNTSRAISLFFTSLFLGGIIWFVSKKLGVMEKLYWSEQAERVKAQARLENEREFEMIASSLDAFIVILDDQGRYTFANEAYQNWLGLSMDQLLGRSPRDLLSQKNIQAVGGYLKKAYEGERQEYQTALERQDGSMMDMLIQCVPELDMDGNIKKVAVLGTNITHLVEKERQLKKALEARNEFLTIASHELKTPLTSLGLNNEIMKMSLGRGASSEALSFARKADGTLAHMGRLVEDMLDIAKIDSGNLSLTIRELNFSKLLKNVFEQQLPLLLDASNGAMPRLEIEEDILINGDSQRVTQVILNLLSNTAKYGAKKPIHVKLTKQGAGNESRALLSVQDQGIGIASENLEKIFQRFERAINKNEASGLGLGLFIVDKIVKEHQGEIQVESKLGEGSTFNVYFPLA